MTDIFISYAKARVGEASELATELGDLGYAVWWDASLVPTGSFGDEIDRQLDLASAVVVIWSPESVRSKWVRSEAAHADRQDKLVNTHTSDLQPLHIPKPFDQTHSVAFDDIRGIVRALDALRVRPSQAQARQGPAASEQGDSSRAAGTPSPAAPPSPRRTSGSQTAHASTRSQRIKVDATFVHGAPDGMFLPGNGKSERFKDLETGPEMVVVPAGSFEMGSNELDFAKPVHTVAIARPFAVGRHLVTYAQWDAAGFAYRPEDRWGRGRQPVGRISWDDAKAYAGWLAKVTGKPYRLLTEAEWEYCCRAGTKTRFAFGDSISKAQAHFNAERTVEVGSYAPNAWGIYDMHGLLCEWCEDVYHHRDYAGRPASSPPLDLKGYRVVRSHCYWTGPDPCATRSGGEAAYRNIGNGIRVARSL